ncbi:putative 54S ribosomal protein L3 [Rosellinia necatrix]|uniref:Large ribosomal subunit protein mL44 n=1 Tax=Rosellinia necatrix TaxID=77044 RepID=A0A1W2TEE0_ROSNE|nr:putative 54S ribosomal protein L3 [Rosellinia necatrix]
MKRIRIDQLSRQWLATTPARPATAPSRVCRAPKPVPAALHSQIRCQSTAITADAIFDEAEAVRPAEESATSREEVPRPPLPSPHPDKALRSAKLAALHARLALSSKFPIKTLARALVDPSADAQPRFNNANLAFVGATLLQYHTSEMLVTKYPRLPMAIMFAAMKGYAGEPALHRIARAWGVESAAAPGAEVDPGYLQFSTQSPTVAVHKWGYVRSEAKELTKYKWRRGMSSRVVFDDPFGNTIPEPTKNDTPLSPQEEKEIRDDVEQNARANFVRAVVGAVYLHCGRDTAKIFIKSHVLSRQLDLEYLFNFKMPQLELTRLCAREDFEPPVARLLSETGRLSRTPVYVVGIYSGRDKLGEAAGSCLDTAKVAACINTLKSWYLYSPGETAVPSDTLADDTVRWKPPYIDMGEIIS